MDGGREAQLKFDGEEMLSVVEGRSGFLCPGVDSQLDGEKREFDASSDSGSSLCQSWWTMIDRGKSWSGGFGVLDFFIEMLASEVNCSGSLVGGACRAMEGDGGYKLAMGGRRYCLFQGCYGD